MKNENYLYNSKEFDDAHAQALFKELDKTRACASKIGKQEQLEEKMEAIEDARTKLWVARGGGGRGGV